jgi:hypothetical protein
MSVEIGTEAAQFPEKEYINGIFVAVYTVKRPILKSSLMRQIVPLEYINTLKKKKYPKSLDNLYMTYQEA